MVRLRIATTETIAIRTLDNIENADRADWSVAAFYAATNKCADCADVARGSDRVEKILYMLIDTCAVKHGPTALADYNDAH